MNYELQLKKVVEFIGKHLDEKLTLNRLSDIACCSKYHFHRLFTAYTGLSLQQYIRVKNWGICLVFFVTTTLSMRLLKQNCLPNVGYY